MSCKKSIYLNRSLFHFYSINRIVSRFKLNLKSPQINIMRLIDPLNDKYIHQKKGHLTDQQTVQNQIRFLGTYEIERKLTRLAFNMSKIDETKFLNLVISPSFEINHEFLLFLKYLKAFGFKIIIEIGEEEKSYKDKYIDFEQKLYARLESIDYYLKQCENIINAGDYYSAIQILSYLNKNSKISKQQKCEIECLLGTCNELIGNHFNALFHWVYACSNGNFNQRNRASYSLSMLYIRHLDESYCDLNLGKDYLNNMYEEIKCNLQGDKRTIELAFNRNGFALALFKEGKIKDAEKMVLEGIRTLKKIDSFDSMFRQTVLLYNVAQCLVKRNLYGEAEKIFKKLIKIDPKFYVYREALIEFYFKNKEFSKMEQLCISSISVDDEHYSYYKYLALKYYALNQKKESVLNFKKVLLLNPFDTDSLMYLSTLLIENNRFDNIKNYFNYIDFSDLNEESFNILSVNYIIILLNSGETLQKIKLEINMLKSLKPYNEDLIKFENELFSEI